MNEPLACVASCSIWTAHLEALAMIGDRLHTDIALGHTAGIVTVLVLSGVTKPGDLEGSPYRPIYTFDNLGTVADWLVGHGHLPSPRKRCPIATEPALPYNSEVV
ncbi:MAG: HAD hydrolase-like protein [Anaerolineae bacterium]